MRYDEETTVNYDPRLNPTTDDYGYDLNADVKNTVDSAVFSNAQPNAIDAQNQSPQERIQKPLLPPGQDINVNIEKAKNMGVLEFINSVRSGGKWDYKLQGLGLKPNPMEASGNMNFGATAKALGLPNPIIKMGAGAYQIYEGHSQPEWGGPDDLFKRNLPSWAASPFPAASIGYLANKYKGVLLHPSHGDQPEDQYNIGRGIEYFDQYQRDKERQRNNP